VEDFSFLLRKKGFWANIDLQHWKYVSRILKKIKAQRFFEKTFKLTKNPGKIYRGAATAHQT